MLPSWYLLGVGVGGNQTKSTWNTDTRCTAVNARMRSAARVQLRAAKERKKKRRKQRKNGKNEKEKKQYEKPTTANASLRCAVSACAKLHPRHIHPGRNLYCRRVARRTESNHGNHQHEQKHKKRLNQKKRKRR